MKDLLVVFGVLGLFFVLPFVLLLLAPKLLVPWIVRVMVP